MDKHTLGQWKVEKVAPTDRSPELYTIHAGDDWFYIAYKKSPGADNELANAHLIATSPKLLRVLQLTQSVLKNHTFPELDLNAIITDVINEAEGKS